jgi:hypothetical protein
MYIYYLKELLELENGQPVSFSFIKFNLLILILSVIFGLLSMLYHGFIPMFFASVTYTILSLTFKGEKLEKALKVAVFFGPIVYCITTI